MTVKWTTLIALAALPVLISPQLASAQQAATPDAGLALELNNAADVDGGCRLSYRVYNGTQTKFDQVSYEVVVFDKGQKISQLVVMDFGGLPVRRTLVFQFDIANLKCADISRLLINNVAKCTAGGKDLPDCLDALSTTTLTDILFGT